MKNDYMISIVVPVYNEEKMIAPFIERTEAVISAVGCEYEIIFALDPCSDNTYGTIKDLMKTHPNVKLHSIDSLYYPNHDLQKNLTQRHLII